MKWLSFPGTPALKNPEQWLSTTGQVAQPGAENPFQSSTLIFSKPFNNCNVYSIINYGLGDKTEKIRFAIQHHTCERSVYVNMLCSRFTNRSFDTLTNYK